MHDHDPAQPPVDQAFDPNDPSLFVEPPKWPKVVGILSIVFGSIAVFCGGVGSAFAPIQGNLVRPALGGDPLPPTMVFSAADWAIIAFSLAVNVLLIVAGVACVGRKPTTRGLHLLYALLSVVSLVLGTWMQWSKQAALQQWLQDYPNSELAQQLAQQQQVAGQFTIVFLAVGVLITLAWPTFCLIWFGLSKTKPEDLTGQPASDPYAA